MVGYSVIGAWAFVYLMMRGGMPMSPGSRNRVKGSDIQVTFADVIGLT